MSQHLQRNQPGAFSVASQRPERGICPHLFPSALHTSITHSPDMWLANPNPSVWVTVCHAHTAQHAHLSLCSHADSHISCFLNPLGQAVFIKSQLGWPWCKKSTKKINKLFYYFYRAFFFSTAARFSSMKKGGFPPDKKSLWICEVTSLINEVKTDVCAFKEQGYHITMSWALCPKGRKKKKDVSELQWGACWE